jgi:hypothetical protein
MTHNCMSAILLSQRLSEEVRVELAAAHATAAAAAKDAEQKAARAAADAALAVKRAATAEAELGKVRAELAKLQQDAKVTRQGVGGGGAVVPRQGAGLGHSSGNEAEHYYIQQAGRHVQEATGSSAPQVLLRGIA